MTVGNRNLKVTVTDRTTSSYDAANQLVYEQLAAGRTTYTFDAAGNQQLSKDPASARTTTTWNYENQPTLYQFSNSTRATYSYNAENRRVREDT